MRQGRTKKQGQLKLPLIKQRLGVNINKSLKLQKINRQKNIALIDISKINKIQKQFQMMTRRRDQENEGKPKKDQMRQSKLLLLRNLAPSPPKKNQNINLLSSLVAYGDNNNKLKQPIIHQNNLSISPTKIKKQQKLKIGQKNIPSGYSCPSELQSIDLVKMFIVQQLLYYISKTNQRIKEEMAGFCKFYIQNTDEQCYPIIAKVLARSGDYLNAIFLQKLGFYVLLILGTDADIPHQAQFLLNSLADYMHTNNLIILDILVEIVQIQKITISSQFHVYNTLRFNEDRRRIKHCSDKMDLVSKNNSSIIDIIRSTINNCGFQSLKTFVTQIINNPDPLMLQKIKQVSLMLISLDGILSNSLQQLSNKPKPPFLPPPQQNSIYFLVLDMDQTLIHTKQIQGSKSIFLKRPYCDQFLQEMSKYYQIIIFTAAVKQYADNILDIIDPKKRIKHRLYRQHTRIQDYVSIKDLGMIGRDLSKSIIVDNIASNFKLQPRNGIAISTWVGDPQDVALFNLIPVLRKLVIQKVNDIRDGLQKISEYMDMKMAKGQQVKFEELSLKGL